jgi:DNA-binding LytR/AlgR family response regulator
MESINVLIIEDTTSESDELKKVLIKNNYNVVGIATSFSDALTQFYSKSVDIVIIDVFLNGKPDGITFAETITTVPLDSKPFVFLTFSKDRQIFERAKLTQPFSFLMKPFNELEVLYAIEMAVEKFYYGSAIPTVDQNIPITNDFLFVKKKNSLKKILLENIVYVEVEERYCNIITEEEKFVIQISLTKILKILENFNFTRTHRNYIINTKKITEIVLSDNLIVLKGNHKIVLSDKYKDFINQFHILK